MNLYRRRTLPASLVVLLACAISVIASGQRRRAHKLRSTAVLELTTDHTGKTTARVIPVTILDEGLFHDASVYKATPQPLALGAGVVYEAQRSGQPVGYVTILNAAKDPTWRALGKWQVMSPPAPGKPKAAVAADSGSENDRPILHRGSSASATPSPAPAPTGATPAPTPTPAATTQPETPTQAEDPNRPVLRHHDPAAATATPENKPQPAASPSTSSAKPQAPAPGTQTMVAVSDADSSEPPRSFQFVWKKGEQADMEARMRRLALTQLPGTPQLTERALTNLVIRAFDLDLSNDAVLVLTAEIPAGHASGRASSGAKGGAGTPARSVSRYLTLIARVNLDGNPQKLATSITDSSRLDVAPRLELIDAVDVDGSGVGALLFREYSFDEKSYVVYAVGRNTVTKVFEGASQPLK